MVKYHWNLNFRGRKLALCLLLILSSILLFLASSSHSLQLKSVSQLLNQTFHVFNSTIDISITNDSFIVSQFLNSGWRNISSIKRINENESQKDRDYDREKSWTPGESLFFSPNSILSPSFRTRFQCLDQWISTSTHCSELSAYLRRPSLSSKIQTVDLANRLDLVWTWVNGTSAPLRQLRKQLLESPTSSFERFRRKRKDKRKDYSAYGPPPLYGAINRGASLSSTIDRAGAGDMRGMGARPVAPVKVPSSASFEETNNHFREHDELRYSLRSVISSLESSSTTSGMEEDTGWGDLKVITADLKGFGQIPTWFQDEGGIQMIHHSQLFNKGISKDFLPSFNSMAIESQFSNLANMTKSKQFLYFNDDEFFLGTLATRDFFNVLTGPVLRVQKELGVDGDTPDHAGSNELEGEWVGLRYANHLLDERFGKRKRPYLQHTVKFFSLPILQEIQEIWGEELMTTAHSRFRGSKWEVAIAFLSVHYTIEKHRETLLWSVLRRWDLNQDGFLDEREKENVVEYLSKSGEKEESNIIKVYHPSHRIPSTYKATNQTATYFTSQEGYPFFVPMQTTDSSFRDIRESLRRSFSRFPLPQIDQDVPVCEIDLEICFKVQEKENLDNILGRIGFQFNEQCGDCIIIGILRQSKEDRGLKDFLPLNLSDYLKNDQDVSLPDFENFKIWSDFKTPILNSQSRIHSIRLLQRYSYTIGDTPFFFQLIRSADSLEMNLHLIAPEKFTGKGLISQTPPDPPLKLLTLNDDMGSQSVKAVNKVLHEFFEAMWSDDEGIPPWEKIESDEEDWS